MQLPCVNKDGAKLHIHLSGDVYSMPLYKDFSSVKELKEYVKNFWNVKNFSYFYSKGI